MRLLDVLIGLFAFERNGRAKGGDGEGTIGAQRLDSEQKVDIQEQEL